MSDVGCGLQENPTQARMPVLPGAADNGGVLGGSCCSGAGDWRGLKRFVAMQAPGHVRACGQMARPAVGLRQLNRREWQHKRLLLFYRPNKHISLARLSLATPRPKHASGRSMFRAKACFGPNAAECDDGSVGYAT